MSDTHPLCGMRVSLVPEAPGRSMQARQARVACVTQFASGMGIVEMLSKIEHLLR